MTHDIVRTTEIVFSGLDDMRDRAARVWDYDPDHAYGANLYNPTVHALEQRIAAWERGSHAVAVQTGQAAIATVLMAFAVPGRTLLLPDNVYGPVRLLAENQLRPLGLKIVYYSPLDVVSIADADIADATLLYLESPGSQTFEIADMDAFVTRAKHYDVVTVIDNTWASPAGSQPLTRGVDIVLQSLSKIMSGGSDVFGGVLSVRDVEMYKKLKNMAVFLGHWLSPDDAHRIAGGLDNLPQRLESQRITMRAVQDFLRTQPAVQQVIAPHDDARFDDYFTTGCSLFPFVFRDTVTDDHVRTFLDALTLFRMSVGWGGPHSLILPVAVQTSRRVMPWLYTGQLMRLYVGQDRAGDLIADLDAGFRAMGWAA